MGSHAELAMDESLLQLGVKPISSDVPAGESVRYEEEFEALQDEVAKLESLKDESVDWAMVVDLGTQILATMSKDLLVACYLTHGLYVTNGYRGLAVGLTIIRDMTSALWSELYPEQKRMRARVSAIKWMVDRLAVALQDNKPELSEYEAVTSSRERAEELERLLDEKLGENKPSGEQEPHWGELHRSLRESDESLSREKKKLELAEAAAEEAAEAAKGTGQPSPSVKEDTRDVTKSATSATRAPAVPVAPGEIGSEQDAERTLRACKDMLKKVASYRREKNLEDPQAYHLLRMAVWADIELPVTQNGLTQVRQPSEERLANINSLMESANYFELIQEVEAIFSGAPFWISLHRYVATALEALGYVDALGVVVGDLSVLLQRFPTLPDCKFVGGDTFADELTQEWIQSSVLAGNIVHDVSSISICTDGSSESGGWLEAGREAKLLAAKGEIRQAVSLLKEGRKLAGTGREQFLWALQEARFWHETGHIEIAVPLIESLDEKVERHNLEHWEPELSFQIAELLLVWYKRMENKGSLSPERVARKERMRSRATRLDAVRAMDLLAKGK